MFTLLVCADMFGSKVNLELTFTALPTIGELTRKVEEVFTNEMHALRPQGAECPPEGIRVSRLQVYDDVLLKWVDLISSTQMHEYDQIYVFQPQTPWAIDTQQDLPAPRPPSGGVSVAQVHPPPHHTQQQQYASQPAPYAVSSVPAAQQGYSGANAERNDLPGAEKVRIVFEEIDHQRRGFIDHSDFERAFRERGLDFSANTIGELFYKADLNRDGKVTYDEWQNFGLIYPNTVDCMYFKGRNTSEEAEIQRRVCFLTKCGGNYTPTIPHCPPKKQQQKQTDHADSRGGACEPGPGCAFAA